MKTMSRPKEGAHHLKPREYRVVWFWAMDIEDGDPPPSYKLNMELISATTAQRAIMKVKRMIEEEYSNPEDVRILLVETDV